MDKIRDVLNQFKGEYKETPDDLLALFKWAIDEEDDDLLKSLIFPGSALISVVHPESKETSLHIASRWRYNTNGAVIQTLIDLGANVNAQSAKDESPLHDALRCGIDNLEEYSLLDNSGSHYYFFRNADILIKNGANVNICSKSGISPIHQALLSGYLEAVEIFLKEEDRLPTDQVFSTTKRIGHLVKCLLKERKSYNISLSNYSSLLHFLILQKDEESFQYVLESTDVIVSSQHFGSYSLLHVAAEHGTPLMIKALIDKSTDSDVCNELDSSLLIGAVYSNMPENVQCLLNCGTSVNSIRTNELKTVSPLYYALCLGNLEIIKMLVKNGADVNALFWNRSPLLISSGFINRYAIIEFLLDQGADIEAQTEDGITSLDRSCMAGNLEVVKLLLSRGAKINVEDFKTLRYAILGENADVVKIILKTGISINLSSLKYGTPLQFAIREVKKREDILTILVAFVTRMIASNKYVSKENRKILREEYVREIYEECRKEIQSMKVKMISGSLKFSFFDILTKELDYLGGVLMEDNVAQILDESDYKTQFPKYAQDLEERIQEGKYRRSLVNQVIVLFRKFVEEELPIEIVLLILKPLSLKDLDNFLVACFFK